MVESISESKLHDLVKSAGIQRHDRLIGWGCRARPADRFPGAGDSREARGRGLEGVADIVAGCEAPRAPDNALRERQVLKEISRRGRAGQNPAVAATILQAEWEALAEIRVARISRGEDPLLAILVTAELRCLRIAQIVAQRAADRQSGGAGRCGNNLRVCRGADDEKNRHECMTCLHVGCPRERQSYRPESE